MVPATEKGISKADVEVYGSCICIAVLSIDLLHPQYAELNAPSYGTFIWRTVSEAVHDIRLGRSLMMIYDPQSST